MRISSPIISLTLALSLGACASGGGGGGGKRSGGTQSATSGNKPITTGRPAETPKSTVSADVACEQQGHYFDLALNECTDRKLMNVTCTLDNVTYPGGSDFVKKNPEATKDFTDEVQKLQIRTVFREQLVGYTLRYCIDDPDQYTLVAVKQNGSSYLLEEVPVPK